MQDPQSTSLRTLFWKEALPAGGFTALLGWLSPQLAHYEWFSPLTNFYVWKILSLFIVWISLRYLRAQGPLQVASFAWIRSFYMLWELWGLVGEEESLGGVDRWEVLTAGVWTGLVVVGSYWVVTRLNRPGLREREYAEASDRAEKA